MNILGTLAAIVLSLFGLQQAPPATLGTAVPLAPALYDGYLASGITSSETSMTLSTGTLRNGQSLSGFICFTLDNGQPTTEYVCGTASSTSVTSLTRGVDVLNPNSSSTSYAYSHRRFASVQISDYPTLQFLVRKANGSDSYDSPIKYTTSTLSTSTIANDPGNLVNVAYVSDVSVTGCSNASDIVRGCVEAGTAAEVASSTQIGGTGAMLFAPGGLFTGNATTSTAVPVTRSSGKLGQWFLDLTEAFSWSGAHTFTGAVTHSATTTLASSTIFSAVSSSSVVVSGGSGATISGVAPGTSGNVLKSDGSSWISGTVSYSTSTVSNKTLTNNTSTLMFTPARASNQTLFVDCGAEMTANNAAVTYTLRTALGSGDLDSCTIGSGTGGAGGCYLHGLIVPDGTTSTTIYINNSNASSNGIGSCRAFAI